MLGAVDTAMPAFVEDLCCPSCGSFLDAPRVSPFTGELARKCPACLEWYGPSLHLEASDEAARETR